VPKKATRGDERRLEPSSTSNKRRATARWWVQPRKPAKLLCVCFEGSVPPEGARLPPRFGSAVGSVFKLPRPVQQFDWDSSSELLSNQRALPLAAAAPRSDEERAQGLKIARGAPYFVPLLLPFTYYVSQDSHTSPPHVPPQYRITERLRRLQAHLSPVSLVSSVGWAGVGGALNFGRHIMCEVCCCCSLIEEARGGQFIHCGPGSYAHACTPRTAASTHS
jgi:hypothetical protein